MQPGQDHNQKQQQQGGRGGDPQREGGASKPGHLRPDIDEKDPTGSKNGQIAQNSQQSSGQGSGQS